MSRGSYKLAGRITFDIGEFNRACEQEGLEPFPLKSYDLEVQDEDHFNLSVRLLRNKLAEWWESQKGEKKS